MRFYHRFVGDVRKPQVMLNLNDKYESFFLTLKCLVSLRFKKEEIFFLVTLFRTPFLPRWHQRMNEIFGVWHVPTEKRMGERLEQFQNDRTSSSPPKARFPNTAQKNQFFKNQMTLFIIYYEIILMYFWPYFDLVNFYQWIWIKEWFFMLWKQKFRVSLAQVLKTAQKDTILTLFIYSYMKPILTLIRFFNFF